MGYAKPSYDPLSAIKTPMTYSDPQRPTMNHNDPKRHTFFYNDPK